MQQLSFQTYFEDAPCHVMLDFVDEVNTQSFARFFVIPEAIG